MMLITEMGLPDYLVRKVISEYRGLLKLNDAIRDGNPFCTLLGFLEDIIPAIKTTKVDGNFGEEYYRLQELVLSGKDDDQVISILLGKAPMPKEETDAED